MSKQRMFLRKVLSVTWSLALLGLVPALVQGQAFVLEWGGAGSGDGQFNFPIGGAVDASGNIYVVEYDNHRVQKFDSNGNFITKWGTQGTGDGQLDQPKGVAVDVSGHVYTVEDGNHRVQKFASDGTFIAKWGSQGSGDGQFLSPTDVAVDALGNVYVADQGNHRVQKFASDGTFIAKWGSIGSGDGQFFGPGAIAIDAFDNVYVGELSGYRVQKFASDGTFIAKWGSQGSGNGQFGSVWGVEVDALGNVYVADRDNSRVQKFDDSGNFITKWGSNGSGPGEFDDPRDVMVDASDNVYVVDNGNSRVQKFSQEPEPTYVLEWGSSGSGDGQFLDPLGIVLDASGNVYAVDYSGHRVQKFDSDGNFLTKWGTQGSGDGQFSYPAGIAIDALGNIYTAEQGNHRIQKFDGNGNFVTKWGSNGSGDGQFASPTDVAVDASGNVYVADQSNHRIQKFDGNGNFVTKWGSNGSGDGQFYSPTGVVVDASGNVYVGDQHNHRVQKFDSNGNFLWSSTGDPNAQFGQVWGVGVDAQGNVYVADQGNDRIQKFDSDGQFIIRWGTLGTGPGHFNNPRDIAVDAWGNTYVVDDDNHRIQKFSQSGFAPPQVEISLPSVTATHNEALTIPVSIDDATGIVAAEVFVEYDTSLLTFTGVSSTGTLTDDWSVESNIEAGTGSLETVKVAVATDQSSATGTATLANLNFTVSDVRHPASSPLTITHALLNDGSPTHTTTDGSVTLVGVDGSIASAPTEIIPREDVTVTIDDADEDRDGNSPDSFEVRVTSGAQTETLVVTETGNATGLFEATISSVFSLGATSGDGIVQAKAGDLIESCYDDSLDASGMTVERCATTDVIGGADGSVAITLVSQPGDPLYIQVTDADLNTSFSAAETSSVTVTNSRTTESFTVVLTEADVDDEVFFGSLPTVAGSSTATEMNTAEEDVVTVTYDDVVTAVGDQQDRAATDEVIDPWGDADDNESLQAFDAAQVLLDVLSGGTLLTGVGELAANVDLDPVGTGITPFDASLILQKRVGLIGAFPVQDPSSTNHPQGAPASPKGVVEQRLLTLIPGDRYLSVVADDRSGIVSGELLIEGIEGRVKMDADLSSFLSASRMTEDGLRIVFAGAQGVEGPGELLRIDGVGSGDVRLTRATFNDGHVGARLDRTVADAQPLRFALLPNAPNPFNPETTIRFALPVESAVRLEVFDALGQRVRTLVAEVLPAGSHQAVWDGRNETGVQVGNGVYFYRLRAGDYTQMRRMLLIK